MNILDINEDVFLYVTLFFNLFELCLFKKVCKIFKVIGDKRFNSIVKEKKKENFYKLCKKGDEIIYYFKTLIVYEEIDVLSCVIKSGNIKLINLFYKGKSNEKCFKNAGKLGCFQVIKLLFKDNKTFYPGFFYGLAKKNNYPYLCFYLGKICTDTVLYNTIYTCIDSVIKGAAKGGNELTFNFYMNRMYNFEPGIHSYLLYAYKGKNIKIINYLLSKGANIELGKWDT